MPSWSTWPATSWAIPTRASTSPADGPAARARRSTPLRSPRRGAPSGWPAWTRWAAARPASSRTATRSQAGATTRRRSSSGEARSADGASSPGVPPSVPAPDGGDARHGRRARCRGGRTRGCIGRRRGLPVGSGRPCGSRGGDDRGERRDGCRSHRAALGGRRRVAVVDAGTVGPGMVDHGRRTVRRGVGQGVDRPGLEPTQPRRLRCARPPRVPTSMVREPSVMAVQWNGTDRSAQRTTPTPRGSSNSTTVPMQGGPTHGDQVCGSDRRWRGHRCRLSGRSSTGRVR